MKLYYSWKYRLGNKRFASTFIILGGGGGGALIFMFFLNVFILWYLWCILMSSFALFLVQFSRAFLVSFGDSAVGILLCFSCCFFHSVVVLLSVHFFALVPFLFYIRFPLVVVLFFAVLLFVVLGCFFFFCSCVLLFYPVFV